MANIWNMLFGKSSKAGSLSTLTDPQQQLHQQLMSSLMGRGGGGAFGDMGNYYRGLMQGGSPDEQAFTAQAQRQFGEDIMPDIANQFAGMGSGTLSSSAFQNAATQAGTDLAERLASMRAQLRQQGMQGLQGMMGMAFNPIKENIYRPETMGLVPGSLIAGSEGMAKSLGMRM